MGDRVPLLGVDKVGEEQGVPATRKRSSRRGGDLQKYRMRERSGIEVFN